MGGDPCDILENEMIQECLLPPLVVCQEMSLASFRHLLSHLLSPMTFSHDLNNDRRLAIIQVMYRLWCDYYHRHCGESSVPCVRGERREMGGVCVMERGGCWCAGRLVLERVG